jgi:hypothetical protein
MRSDGLKKFWTTYDEFVFFLSLPSGARKRYPTAMQRRRDWGDIDRTRLMKAVKDTLAGKRIDPESLIRHRRSDEAASTT